jgi:TRAP-type C4-dicarboxylate transport system substrate-binding protein
MSPRAGNLGIAAAVLSAAVATVLPAAAADPVEIKFANPGVPNGAVAMRIITPLAQRLNRLGEGAIEVKVFTGPTLANYGNVFDRVVNGVADMAFGLLGPVSSQFPRSTVTALPFETPNGETGSIAIWRLLASGALANEWSRVKPIATMVFPNVGLHSRKPIVTLADMKGTKLSAQTRPTGASIERLGGVPITMPVSELYPSLQRGIIEAATIGWPAASAYKLPEVANYHVQVPLGSELTYLIMNNDSYARLPEKGRAAVDATATEAYAREVGRILDGVDDEESAKAAARPGQSVTKLATDEAARWKARVAPVTEEWAKSTPDGAKVLAAYRTEVVRLAAGQ